MRHNLVLDDLELILSSCDLTHCKVNSFKHKFMRFLVAVQRVPVLSFQSKLDPSYLILFSICFIFSISICIYLKCYYCQQHSHPLLKQLYNYHTRCSKVILHLNVIYFPILYVKLFWSAIVGL